MSNEGIVLKNGRAIPCKPDQWLADQKWINKTSASPTEIIFGRLKDPSRRPISVKVFLDVRTSHLLGYQKYANDVLGLEYEIEVYKTIISRIVKGKHSPNFIKYVGSGYCKPSIFGRQFMAQMNKVYKGDLVKSPETRMGLLITEKAGGEEALKVYSLKDIWDGLTFIQKLQIVFQLVFSIAVMQKFRLVHNDLHAANVLVAKYPTERTYVYRYKNNVYEITSIFTPYLFDWDTAFCGALGNNPKITNRFCKLFNICNRFSEKTDLYILFCTLEFPQPIGNLFNPKGVENLNTEISIPLPRFGIGNEIKRNIQPYIPDSGVYKMSRVEMNSVFGENWVNRNLGEGATTAMFTLSADFMVLYSGFRCRPTLFDSSIPSPLELLESTRFNNLLARRPIEEYKEIWTYPTWVDTKSSVFINPLIPSTREKIDPSVKRRFPNMKDLYVYSSYRDAVKAEEDFGRIVLTQDDFNRQIIRMDMVEKLITRNKYPIFVYFLSHMIMSIYLSSIDVPDSDYRLIALMSLVYAMQVTKSVFTIANVLQVAQRYTLDQANAVMKTMKTMFDGKFIPTSMWVAEKIASQVNITNINIKSLLSASKHYRFMSFRSTIIGCAVVFNHLGEWPSKLSYYTKYTTADLQECADFLRGF